MREKGAITNLSVTSAPWTARLGYYYFKTRVEVIESNFDKQESSRADQHIQLNNPSASELSMLLGDGDGGRQVNKVDVFWSFCIPLHPLNHLLVIKPAHLHGPKSDRPASR